MNYTEVLVALISAGLLKYAFDGFKWLADRKKRGSPEARDALHVSTADASLTVVARARDELEDDNKRLRSEIAEKDARYARDRDRWEAKEASMRREIDTLERKVRDILDELEQIKLRHP